MNRNQIIAIAEQFTQTAPTNYITAEAALNPRCAGLKIFDSPIFAIGSANDEIYIKYKSPAIIGSHFLTPKEWLPEAKTVLSFFLPYSASITAANTLNPDWPADEWLHCRIEGQLFAKEFLLYIKNFLSEAGYKTLVPILDQRFKIGTPDGNKFTSNWSERHVAFACGLGTFGLSKGFITAKGMCGRMGSVVTEMDLPQDSRLYEDVYEYCSMCGSCIKWCPVCSISFAEGKDHLSCSEFLDKTLEIHHPRYGCGKCQTGVPCGSEMPKKRKEKPA